MLTFIQPFDADDSFPPLSRAETDPNGLLAIGGDLSPSRLLVAYKQGIFPWYETGQPILWWSPNPRMVLFPSDFHASKSLRKSIKKNNFFFSIDMAFETVVDSCAKPRSYSENTWITAEMMSAYVKLHEMGHAHSVEIWQEDKLVGGLYGISLGEIFFGESMFSTETDASKAAFWALSHYLVENNIHLIDCQVYSEHLERLGAIEINRNEFSALLQKHAGRSVDIKWRKGKANLQDYLQKKQANDDR